MRARLKATIYRWKTTALATTKKLSLTRARLRRAQARISRLESELAELRAQRQPTKVKGHTYPAELIALAVFIVIQGKGSLRCAAKAVGYVAQLLGWSYPAPSHSSVRRWIVRLGLAQLQQTAEYRGEYIGLLDESIQIGAEKLLLFLGLRVDHDQRRGRPLRRQDVRVLGLEVQSSWTGVHVAEFLLRRLRAMPGLKLRYCITDGGTNLNKALRICGISAVGDCTHVMMNAVKKALNNHAALSQLAANVGRFRRQTLLSADGWLAPPTLRDKDRFLRIFTLLPWVDRTDRHWHNLSAALRNKLAFLTAARPGLVSMRQLKTLVELSAGILKGAGLSARSQRLWEKAVAGYAQKHVLSPEAQLFIDKLRAYFTAHEGVMDRYGRLVCCTDIVESTFGRYKNKGGMAAITADALGITLYGLQITPELVRKSLLTVPYQTVQAWESRHICENRYGRMRRIERELESKTA